MCLVQRSKTKFRNNLMDAGENSRGNRGSVTAPIPPHMQIKMFYAINTSGERTTSSFFDSR